MKDKNDKVCFDSHQNKGLIGQKVGFMVKWHNIFMALNSGILEGGEFGI